MGLPKKVKQFLKKRDRKSLLSLGELIQENSADLSFNGEHVVKLYNNRFWIKARHYDFDSMPGVRLICLFYYLSASDGVIKRDDTKEFLQECLETGGFGPVKVFKFLKAYFSGKAGDSFLVTSQRQSSLMLTKEIKFVKYDYAK